MTDINKDVLFYYSQNCDVEEDKKLLEPLKYISQCNEKMLKLNEKLITAFNHWLKIPSDKLQQINEILHIMYNVLLLIDDVQDNSALRERFPSANSIYGFSNSLNAANYALMISFDKLNNLHPAAAKTAIEDLLECHRGQGMYAYWNVNLICPTEEEYNIMAIRTCAHFKSIIRLMQLFSTCKKDFSRLTNILAVYYRIQDDYYDLYVEKDDKGDNCDDLTEGKFTFPIIHALTNNPDEQIINILRQQTKTVEMKRHFVKLLENFGSFKYTKNRLEELDKKMKAEIEHLGGNPILLEVIDEILKTFTV